MALLLHSAFEHATALFELILVDFAAGKALFEDIDWGEVRG